MNSQQVKEAFKAAGIAVRVADLGAKFRICPASDKAADLGGSAVSVAASLGLTSSLCEAGGQFNTPRELIGYKPGTIRRVNA